MHCLLFKTSVIFKAIEIELLLNFDSQPPQKNQSVYSERSPITAGFYVKKIQNNFLN